MVNCSNSLLTVAEYFAGIGLVRMGLAQCGWGVTFANDISPKKFEMYKAFFPDAESHYLIGDIFNLSVDEVPRTILATCSFPCIDLSLAGKMNGISGRHSSAFWGFIRALTLQGNTSPPLVLLENVPGWLRSNSGKDFRQVLQALNNLGYATDVFALNALRFTPQSRLRIFVLGVKSPVLPNETQHILNRSRILLPENLKVSIKENMDLVWIHTPLPEPPLLQTSGLTEIIESLDDADSRWWSEVEVSRHLKMMNSTHFTWITGLRNSDTISYRTFCRRRRNGYQRVEVRNDNLSGCLRTAAGGSGKQFVIKVGQGLVNMRAMTPREYARLQGVPDHYPITVSDVQALTGFGDAVCVPAIKWIAQHALTPLAEKYLTYLAPNAHGTDCAIHPKARL